MKEVVEKVMQKIFKRLKTSVLVVTMVILAFIILPSARFIVHNAIYYSYNFRIYVLEQQAARGYWTPSGLAHWSDDMIDAYNSEKAKKHKFIEGHDTAKFLYYSGFSITGKVIRVITLIFTSFLIILSFTTIKLILKVIKNRFIVNLKRSKMVATK